MSTELREKDVVQCSVTLKCDRTGNSQTFILSVGGRLRIGRHPENDFVLDVEGVSSCHAELQLVTGDVDPLIVRDKSKNGTGLRPGPKLTEKWFMGIAPKWEPLKKGGKRTLDHGWQLLMPLKAEGKQWPLTVLICNRLSAASAAQQSPERSRPMAPLRSFFGELPARSSTSQAPPPKQPSAQLAPDNDGAPLPPDNDGAPPQPPPMASAMEEMMARIQAFARAKERERCGEAPLPTEPAPPPPDEPPPEPPGPPPEPPQPPPPSGSMFFSDFQPSLVFRGEKEENPQGQPRERQQDVDWDRLEREVDRHARQATRGSERHDRDRRRDQRERSMDRDVKRRRS